MAVTVGHVLTATTPDNTSYEIRPSHWNSVHAVTLNLSGTDISQAFSNANGISFGLSNGAITGSYTVPAGGGQTGISSLIAGQTQSIGALSFSNANGVSFGIASGANTGTLTASVAAQTVQTQASGAIVGSGFTSGGANVGLSGTLNSAGLSLSATVAAQSAQTQSNIQGLIVSNTTYTTGNVSFSNANGISFGSSAGQAITASYTVPTVTNSSWSVSDAATSGTVGRLAFTNLNGVTLSLSTGAGGSHTIVGSHNALTSQSGQAFSADASSTFQTLTFQNSNGVSFSNNAGALRVTHDLQYTSATSAITANAMNSSVSFAFSAGAGGSSTFQTLSFSDSNGFSWSNFGGAIGLRGLRLSINATGNTTQSTSGSMLATSVIISGAGIASVGVSAGTIIISVPSGGGGGDGGVFAGVSNLGNTAGSTGTVSTGNFVLVGSGGVSLSQSTGAAGSAATVTINAPASSSIVGFNGGTVSTAGSTISVGQQPVSAYELDMRGASTTQTLANGTWYFQPAMVSVPLSAYQMIMMQQMTTQSATTWAISASVSNASSSTLTGSYAVSGTAAVFSRQSTGTAANSSNIISVYSNTSSYSHGYTGQMSWNANGSSATCSVSSTFALAYLANIDSAGGTTGSTTSQTGTTSFSSTSTAVGSFSTSFANSFLSGHLSGVRPNYVPFAVSLPPNEYWIGIRQSTTRDTQNAQLSRIISMNPLGILCYTTLTQGFMEIGNSVSFATSNLTRGWGSGNMDSVTSTTFGLNSISNMSNMQSYFQLVAKTN